MKCLACDTQLTPDGVCDTCNGKNGKLFADGVRRDDCPICGGKETRKPSASNNFGQWWNTTSRWWIRVCSECGFMGDNLAFEAEATRRMMASMPSIINMADIEEIPY